MLHLSAKRIHSTLSCHHNKDTAYGFGGRHSSVVSSAPTILRPRVRIPSFFQFVLLKLWWEKDENKQKVAGIGPFEEKN